MKPGDKTGLHSFVSYWCPVNLYERPTRRVLGKRIEGVASDLSYTDIGRHI